ncbi:FadR/GntR family transcriptional regulator [Brevibacterium yomogidense]|uniref:FadR/GntR family transcriptional regulator n=1 Tax=Brevibacterium yomogidense TaxID=946573 RepID=UPI0018DF59FB|nr:FCD domain-containing protein [Brevibacterium yomogidense]
MSGVETVAADLRDRILSGDLSVGSPLPPERELGAQVGVSRTTVRGALAQLAAEGLVDRRVGRGGGTFVAEPGARQVTAALQRGVGMAGFPAVDLAEARMAIEPRCAALAATRMTSEQLSDLRALQSVMARAQSRGEFFEANARFHVLIAEGSGNEVLAAIIRGLIAPIRDITDDPARIRDAEMRETVRVHELLLAALVQEDASGAESLMRGHLQAHVDVLCGARPV